MINSNSLGISVIIPAKNEGRLVLETVESLRSSSDGIEIIVVDDNSQDGCCEFLKDPKYSYIRLITTEGIGAARARNLGATLANGDILVFSDAHVIVEKGWVEQFQLDFSHRYIHALVPAIAPVESPENAGYGQSWQRELNILWFTQKPKGLKPIPLAPGGFLAIRKEVFNAVGGFDQGFKVWGKEDEEISLKLWLMGYEIFVEPKVKILHVFRKSHPYYVNMEHVHYNFLRMIISHFNEQRIAKAIGMIKSYNYAEKILTDILLSDTLKQREKYLAQRKHNDDWFMKRFNINF